MDSDKKIDATDTQGKASALPMSSSRRRLLQAGIGASPVVLSVIARPVRAAGSNTGTKTCRSASAFASVAVNANSSQSPVATCSGYGPAYWKDQIYFNNAFLPQSGWPAGSVSTATSAFSASTYSVTTPTSTVIANPTVAEVLAYSTGSSARDQLARNIAAAKLNVAVGKTPLTVIPAGVLDAMWQATQGGGTYTVSPGTNWDASQVSNWLTQSTFNTL